ncbi:hypothetical protein CHUAL_004659 [Chamberlinius hualienensis]
MLQIAFIVLGMLIAVSVGRLEDRRQTNNLTCYTCHTLTHKEICNPFNESYVTLMPNATCPIGYNFCQVRRFSFSANGTDSKVWMIERNCTNKCVNECVITGDRSKLHLCTSCCQNNTCNVGNSAVLHRWQSLYLIFAGFILCKIHSMYINERLIADDRHKLHIDISCHQKHFYNVGNSTVFR